MRKSLLPALGAVILLLIGSVSSANANDLKGFKRHQEVNWTWFGPKNWGAAEGPYDIWISSPTGSQYLHYGAGGAPCVGPPNYSDPASFLAFVRRSYLSTARQNFSMYSKGINRARFTRVGPIRTIDTNYVRQVSRFRGVHRGTAIRGEMVLDFFLIGDGVCAQRQQVRAAPARGYRKSIRTLRTVQSAIYGPKDQTGLTG